MATSQRAATRQRTDSGAFERYYQRLNERQREAVDAIEGPVMVVAGPGTGKTQVLAMRIARILLSTQMDPWNVLCLTFTESGVAAMRERLVEIIGEAAYYVRVRTFHSFCNDVIQEFPERFADVRADEVLSDSERIEVFRLLVDRLPADSSLKPFGNPYVFLSDIMHAVQSLKGEGITHEVLRERLAVIERFAESLREVLDDFFALKPSDRTAEVCETLFDQITARATSLELSPSLRRPYERLFEQYRGRTGAVSERAALSKLRTKLKSDVKRWYTALSGQLPRQHEVAGLYVAYQQELQERGRYDYADMILWVVERLRRDDELLARYQEQFQYILVDEYQDTNSAQNEVLRLLGSYDERPNVFVVGDDQQSIYRFQGASLENMLYFHELYKDSVTLITLSDTYRSHQTILDAARAVVGRNEESLTAYIPQVGGMLQDATRGATEPLQICAFDTEAAEYYFVARQIHQLLERGVDPGAIAVLYRYHRDADPLVDLLVRLGVPFRVAAGENVLADRRIHQFLTLLTYLADVGRDHVLVDLLQCSWLGLDSLDVLRAVHYAGQQRLSVFGVLADTTHLAAAGVQAPDQFTAFVRRVAGWRSASSNMTLMAWFDRVLQESGFLQQERDGEYVRLLHNLTTLFDELKRLSHEDPHITLRAFMDRLQMLRESGVSLMASPLRLKRDAVTLMTAHQAKGLEFEHVFVIRLVDRHWGNVRGRGRSLLPHGLLAYDLVAGDENNEDERRLFYVALTRAQRGVYLTYARHAANERAQVPSIFLHELPESCVERVTYAEVEDEALERLETTVLTPLPAVARVDLRAWLGGVLEHYVMSVTHLNNYLECPRLFYFRNLLRVPSAKTRHMSFGTAVHRALRDFVAAYARTGKLPAKSYLLDRFRRALEFEVLTDVEREDSRVVGEQVLGQYYDYYRGDFVPTELLEYNFSSHGVHLDSLRLTGMLDKVEPVELLASEAKHRTGRPWRPDTGVNVVDYKTGNPDAAAAKCKPGGTYHRQLVFYKLLCDLSPRFAYEMVSGEIDFVQPSKRTGKLVKRRFEITSAATAELTEEIRRVWSEIQELRFLEDDAGCGECVYCKGGPVL